MRLVYIFAAVLAVSVVESSDENKLYDDLEAMETMELKKEKRELIPEASPYNYVPQQTWNQNQNYVPQNQPQYYPNNNNNYVTSPPYVPPVTSNPPYVPPVTASPPYVPPVTSNPSYVPPVQSDYVPPQYPPVQSDYVSPQYPPQRPPRYPPQYPPKYPPHQHTYYPPTWTTPHYHTSTTTTPIPVIKNEQYYGENGSYKYEYEIADGTHVAEEGYFTDPKGSEESLVKKGFYSYRGGDGIIYTVTYWADKTGYHAYGSHLPTPPPVPAAIQAALDKEEAEKNKPPTGIPPTQSPPYNPHPTWPGQQTYYPPQQTYYPQQPGYGK